MNTKALTTILLLLLLVIIGYLTWQGKFNTSSKIPKVDNAIDTPQKHSSDTISDDKLPESVDATKAMLAQKPKDSVQKKGSFPSNWKTYSNKNLGFTFQYPEAWAKYGEESNVINLSGTVVATEIYLKDSISNTTLLIKYYLAPSGADLYRFASSQFESSIGVFSKSRERIVVGGNKGVKGSTIMEMDGKGHRLEPALRLIVVDFLDKQGTGTIELQFTTSVTSETKNIENFNQLLKTFQFKS